MLKVSVRGFVLAACVCGLSPLLDAGATQAQTTPAQSLALLPLEEIQVEATTQTLQLAAIAQSINTQNAYERSLLTEPEGLTLADIPLIGELVDNMVDEKGNFDGGFNLPVSVGVGDVMGAYGVTVSMDWSF